MEKSLRGSERGMRCGGVCFIQAEGGIRNRPRSRGLGDEYKGKAVEQINAIRSCQCPHLPGYGGLSHMEYFRGSSKTSCTRNCMKRTKLGIADL